MSYLKLVFLAPWGHNREDSGSHYLTEKRLPMVCDGGQAIIPHIPVTWDQVPTEYERFQQLLWANL